VESAKYTRDPKATHVVLNMGAGRQSVALLAMAIHGELPMPDLVIHADTGHERRGTDAYLQNVLIPKCKKAGVPLSVVRNGSIKEDTLNSVRTGARAAQAPYFVKKPSGKPGMLRRICTSEYKIVPIEREIRRFLGVKPGHRVRTKAHPYFVEQWIGIATEESQRKSVSHKVWSELTFPLLDLDMDTPACIEKIKQLGWPVPIKSACIACPFRSDASWAHMKKHQPEEFAEAVDFDTRLRWPDGEGRLNWRVGLQEGEEPSTLKGAQYPAYVHSSCRPLGEIEFVDDGTGENFGGAFC
jgi:hypothetical protein